MIPGHLAFCLHQLWDGGFPGALRAIHNGVQEQGTCVMTEAIDLTVSNRSTCTLALIGIAPNPTDCGNLKRIFPSEPPAL